jgi:hypothetical protein
MYTGQLETISTVRKAVKKHVTIQDFFCEEQHGEKQHDFTPVQICLTQLLVCLDQLLYVSSLLPSLCLP